MNKLKLILPSDFKHAGGSLSLFMLEMYFGPVITLQVLIKSVEEQSQ